MIWTIDMIERLKELVDIGLSANGAAIEMGVTRNAIIGKCHRIGIELSGPKPIKKELPALKFGTSRPEKKIIAPSVVAEPEPLLPHHGPITLMELTNTTCRWPFGSRGNVMYCGKSGADVSMNEPYCSGHRAMAYEKKERRLGPAFPRY